MNSNSMNYISDEITLQIQQIQLQIISLKCQEKEGTITSAGAAFLDELTKKEFKLKEQKVLEVHTNAIQSGTLNLAFRYASDPDHRIIAVNIVPSDNGPYKKNLTMSDDRPEEKAFQPHEIEMIREYLWSRVEKEKYDVNGYAILFSSHTGVRQGEIPSLKWEDISEKLIHIHSQQNDRETANGKEYYYNPTTKNEKGESKNGRYIPLTQEVKHILNELKKKQEALGIHSEWVFAKEDGNWTTTVAYYESLYKICIDKLGLGLSNNHAFRIALNSYVLIPMGLDAPERARILGHSVQTNLEHYTFSRDKEFLSEIGDLWDNFNKENGLSKVG